MGNFGYAFRILWKIWRDALFADQIRQLEAGKLIPAPEAPAVQSKPARVEAVPAHKSPTRSEALTLLATLQREARFVDFIKEPIAAYSDAQVGAAVRDVHKQCAATLDRLFAIQPLEAAAEGSPIEVPAGYDPVAFKLAGKIPNEPPFRGKLAHPGWKASQCELPNWTGSPASVWVIAPAEIDIP